MPAAEQYVVIAAGRIMVAVTIGPDGVTIDHGTGRLIVQCAAPQMAHTPKGDARVGARVEVDEDGVATVLAAD